MRLGQLVIVVGVLLAWGGTSRADEGGKTGPTRLSSSSRFAVRMRELGKEQCKLEVLEEQEVRWALEGCVGNADDFYFVSDTGDRVWVLYSVPEDHPPKEPLTPPRKPRPAADPFTRVTVARLYDRGGKVLRSKSLGELVPRTQRDKVQQLGKHFKWLGGVAGVTGVPPRVNDHNQVQLETVAQKTLRLDF